MEENKDKQLVREILKELGLKQKHETVCAESFSELRPTYHNEEHCYSTALTFHDLAREAKLSLEEIRHGFLAALYHDANHRLSSNDSKNIRGACEWFKEHSPAEKNINVEEVLRLIRSTNNSKSKYSDKTEELLHDADLLQTVKGSPAENAIWRLRLSKELFKKRITDGSSVLFVKKSLICPEAVAFFNRLFK